jgi:putative DNA primase/helicase
MHPMLPKALSAANITVAAMFRTVEACRPTLLIDEADSFLKDNEELRGIINCGHARDGQVIRLVGEDHEPRVFSTWCPVAIAAIGGLPGTIEDRSVIIQMRRRRPDEGLARFRVDRVGAQQELGRKAARWVADSADALRDADPALPAELNDRAADNWRPLLAIADRAGGPWPEKARRAALELSAVKAGEADTMRTQLLSDIRGMFREKKVDRIKSETLVAILVAMTDRPWPTFDRGRWITPAGIARMLKPFGIGSETIRFGEELAKGYRLSAFEDAFARYLPSEGVTA